MSETYQLINTDNERCIGSYYIEPMLKMTECT